MICLVAFCHYDFFLFTSFFYFIFFFSFWQCELWSIWSSFSSNYEVIYPILILLPDAFKMQALKSSIGCIEHQGMPIKPCSAAWCHAWSPFLMLLLKARKSDSECYSPSCLWPALAPPNWCNWVSHRISVYILLKHTSF